MLPEALKERLLAKPSMLVLTGAGISAESGIPTFRDAQTGLWARFKPEQLATPQAFAENPKRVWDWYQWRRELIAVKSPNAGHLALAEMEALLPEFHLVTQNIDGFHQAAGNKQVIELHGNIHRNRCSGCTRYTASAEACSAGNTGPPPCPVCGIPLRPDVVWFGEMLPEAPLIQATHLARSCEMTLVVGTSSLVYPAAGLPEQAVQSGNTVVEINPVSTPLSRVVDFRLRGKAGGILPHFAALLTEDAPPG